MYGCTIEEPEDPIRPGRVFAGWYLGATKWNFDFNVVTEAITLTGHWVLVTANPNVYVSNLNASFNSVTFDIHKDEVSEITSVVLYKGNDVVETLEDLDNPQFDNLLASTQYNIRIFYKFDLGDGYTPREESVDKWFITQSVTRPTAYISSLTSSYTSIEFNLWENDPLGIGEFVKAELFDEENEIVASITENLTNGAVSFTDLNTNTLYKVVITYQFDMYDGLGVQTQENLYQTIRTLSYGEPTISFKDIAITSSKITGTVVYTDLDQVGEFIKVSLYKGETEESYFDEKDFTFEDLDPNSEYKLVVAYKYDLHDGKGVQNATFTKTVHTHPEYVLTETTIVNSDALIEGDTVYLHAYIDNDNPSVKFKSAKINGVECEITAYSMTDIYVTYASLALGETAFTIEEIYVELDGNEFVYSATENNITTAKIYKGIKILSTSFSMGDDENLEYLCSSNFRSYDLSISIENPEGYSIGEIKTEFSYNSVETNEDNTLITLKGVDTRNYYLINSITINISETKSRKILTNYLRRIPSVQNSTPIQISSVEEFYNIESSKAYELTSDLDFSGIEHVPSTTYLSNIYFNGNNHSIKNLILTKANGDNRVALFHTISDSSLFKNLRFSRCAVLLSSSVTYAGLLAGSINESTIENVNIDASNTVSYENVSSGEVGGVSGRADRAKFVGCTFSMNVKATGTMSWVNYLFGYGYSNVRDPFVFENCGFTGNFTYENRSYLCAYIEGGESAINVKNCYSTALVNGSSKYDLFNISTRVSSSYDNYANLSNQYANQVLSFGETKYIFDTKGGSKLDSVTAPFISLDEYVPTKEGYCFAGWYTSEDCQGESFSSYWTEDSEITLYAKWVEASSDSSIFTMNDWDLSEGGLPYTKISKTVTSRTIKVNLNKRVHVKFDLTIDMNTGNSNASANLNVYTNEQYMLNGNWYSNQTTLVSKGFTSTGTTTYTIDTTLNENQYLYIYLYANVQEEGAYCSGTISNIEYAVLD